LWNKNLVEVVTNLRTTSFRFADWGKLSHGCALAAIGHALSQRINLVLIGASYDNKALIPWGSHPVTDPLLGSRQTKIIHYGSEYRRTEKITFLAKHKIALDNLHVCYAEQSGKNCGKCEKCLRTMVALELIHKLNEATSFPRHADLLSAYLKVGLSSRGSRIFAGEIAALASQLGETGIERQILSAITRGKRIELFDRFLSPTRAFLKISNRIRQQHPQFLPLLKKIQVIVDRH
jgi:hypothetical protein